MKNNIHNFNNWIFLIWKFFPFTHHNEIIQYIKNEDEYIVNLISNPRRFLNEGI